MVADRRSVNCFTCQARQKNEWCSLPDEDVGRLNASKICNVYRPGQVIFYQGNPCLGVYCIEEGTIALRKSDANGNSVLIRLLTSGETMGYRTFFSGGQYTATAEAVAETRVCFVDKSAVRKLLDDNPSLGLSFLKRLGTDLEGAENSMLHQSTLPVRARLCHLLLTMKDRFGSVDDEGTLTIDLPLQRQDLAAMVGTRPETIARTVKAIQSDGVARFEGRRVLVPDLDDLLDEVEL